MENKEILKVILALIGAAFGKDAQIAEDVDWDKLFFAASKHHVANIVCYALDKLKIKPEEKVYNAFKIERMKAIRADMLQEHEIETVLKAYDSEDIAAIALKGFVLKSMYPSRDMRIMGDLDLLLKREDIPRGHEILIKNGYSEIVEEYQDKETNPHEEYQKPPVMVLELHKFLFPKKGFEEIFEYYSDIWEKCEPIDGYKNIYRMNNEEFYIYMIFHIMKHYKRAGTGIRSILDVWVFLKNAQIDWEYVDGVLERFGMKKFEEHIRTLCGIWFDGKASDNSLYAEMGEYIFESGTYGTEKNFKTREALDADGENASGIKYMMKIAFPEYKAMCVLYPSLKKIPFALPIYWIVRIIDKTIHKKEELKKEIEISSDSKYLEKLQKHFDEVGV